jgi:hypothetical protein
MQIRGDRVAKPFLWKRKPLMGKKDIEDDMRGGLYNGQSRKVEGLVP